MRTLEQIREDEERRIGALKVQLCLTISRNLDKRVRLFARIHRKAMSAVICEALDGYLRERKA